jgi:hypothetical protein
MVPCHRFAGGRSVRVLAILLILLALLLGVAACGDTQTTASAPTSTQTPTTQDVSAVIRTLLHHVNTVVGIQQTQDGDVGDTSRRLDTLFDDVMALSIPTDSERYGEFDSVRAGTITAIARLGTAWEARAAYQKNQDSALLDQAAASDLSALSALREVEDEIDSLSDFVGGEVAQLPFPSATEATTTIPPPTTTATMATTTTTMATTTTTMATTTTIATTTTDAPNRDGEVIVHITRTGEKYHRAGCRYLRQSDITISLTEAKERGYDP